MSFSSALNELLVAGDDSRIALDPITGRNKYGCGPLPDASIAAFGSSTASTISPQGYDAALRLLPRLDTRSGVRREAQRIQGEFLELCGIADIAGLEMILAPSGTDLHRIASNLADCEQALMLEANESGSGVPNALSRGGKTRVSCIAVRNPDGTARKSQEIDADFLAQGSKSTLLVLTDVSKSGMIAPSISFASQFGHRVLVDACQFRISGKTLRNYLEQDFMVAITGSKFLTGPSFSGMLLLPKYWAKKMEAHAEEEPPLLLRAQAALAEFEAFSRIAPAKVKTFFAACAQKISEHLDADPAFVRLPAPPLLRDGGWDEIQSIFPFMLQDPRTNSPLSSSDTEKIYRQLQQEKIEFGQPLICAGSSALRLSLSARLAVQEYNHPDSIVQAALAALQKTRTIAEKSSIVRR